MLAIRLQRVGRKGLPMYRLAIQEAWRSPTSGRVVAYVGTYNPHTKEVTVQKDAAQKYLDNGAQPTPRVVKLLKAEGVKLPHWVEEADSKKQKQIKNVEKLRRNQPKEGAEAAPAEPATEEASVEDTPAAETQASTETPAETPEENPVEASAAAEAEESKEA